ncbi:hypothetical protein ACROYT_G040599 [Oculina patagonica]
MGYIYRGDFLDNGPGTASQSVEAEPENSLPEDFYEIDKVIGSRLSKDTLTYQFRVRFKGYSSDDDMWLPASYFNRVVNYQSVSKFGRKRKHKIDPDTAQEIPEKRKRAASSGEKTQIERKGNDSKKSSPSQKQKSDAPPKKKAADSKKSSPSQKQKSDAPPKKKAADSKKSSPSQKQKSDAPPKKKAARRGNKGKTFRSSLPCGTNESIYKKQPTEGVREKDFKIEREPPAADVNSHTFVNLGEISEEEEPADIGVLADVLRRDDNFRYPRRMLGESTFPDVDRKLARFSLDGSMTDLTNPITVTKLPPQSVLEKIAKELSPSQNANSTAVVAQIPLYGNFNKEGIRVLQRFHRVKRLRSEVSFEMKWLEMAFKDNSFTQEVTEALLDRWNLEGKYLASYDNYRISSQELSLLVGERPHELVSLGTRHIFDEGSTVYFDDGYHCPVPQELKTNARDISNIIFRATGNDAFNPSSWCDVERFTVPLPDQPSAVTGSPDGCGSCGVAVICAIRDVCNGNTESFTWTYQEAPQLRAGLMLEVLDLHKRP